MRVSRACPSFWMHHPFFSSWFFFCFLSSCRELDFSIFASPPPSPLPSLTFLLHPLPLSFQYINVIWRPISETICLVSSHVKKKASQMYHLQILFSYLNSVSEFCLHYTINTFFFCICMQFNFFLCQLKCLPINSDFLKIIKAIQNAYIGIFYLLCFLGITVSIIIPESWSCAGNLLCFPRWFVPEVLIQTQRWFSLAPVHWFLWIPWLLR